MFGDFSTLRIKGLTNFVPGLPYICIVSSILQKLLWSTRKHRGKEEQLLNGVRNSPNFSCKMKRIEANSLTFIPLESIKKPLVFSHCFKGK